MLQLARRYGRRPSEEWRPLFYRILQNRIRDYQRRRRVQARIMAWLPGLKSHEDDGRRGRIRGRAGPRAAAGGAVGCGPGDAGARAVAGGAAGPAAGSVHAAGIRGHGRRADRGRDGMQRRQRQDTLLAGRAYAARAAGSCVVTVDELGTDDKARRAVRGQRRAAGRAHAIEADTGAQSRAGRGQEGRGATPLDLGARRRVRARRGGRRRRRAVAGPDADARVRPRSKTWKSSPTRTTSSCCRTWSSTPGWTSNEIDCGPADAVQWLAAAGAQAAEQPRAAAPAAGVPWAQLSEDQRTLLSDLESRWSQLPPRAAEPAGAQLAALAQPAAGAARRGAGKLPALAVARCRAASGNPPPVSSNSTTCPEAEQARIRDNYRRFRDLTPEQRQELRKRFKELTPRGAAAAAGTHAPAPELNGL